MPNTGCLAIWQKNIIYHQQDLKQTKRAVISAPVQMIRTFYACDW